MQPLDHGALNIPLARRGNIDAQIDRYKADQARRAKADRQLQAALTAAARIEAKALLAAVTAERLAQLAERNGLTVAALKRRLKSDAHWLPETVIRLLAD